MPSLLRAHAYVRTEAPPEPWTPEADDTTLVPLVGEMLAAALARGTELADVTLSFANVVVEPDPDDPGPMPTGDHVAVSVLGGGDWSPERTWRPGDGGAPFVSPDLHAAAERAGAVFGYTRQLPDGGGGVVVWFRRAG